MKITRFNLSIYMPIAFIVAILTQVLFVFTNNACAQSKSPKKDSELVNQIFKFLGRESNINSLRSKQECYAFNLRIEFKKNGNKAVVSTVKSSSAIGTQIFSNYNALEKLDYSSVIGNNSHAVVVMPILILNNPTDEKNPGDAISGMNKKSLQDLISSMLYPDVLQKNRTHVCSFADTAYNHAFNIKLACVQEPLKSLQPSFATQILPAHGMWL